jgi:dUTP pyrophosphatase
MNFNVKRARPEAVIPSHGTEGAAGWDLSACIPNSVRINPGKMQIIPTGISIELPSCEYVAEIFLRSGTGVKNQVSNILGTGVIDSDYRGEIFIPIVNHSDKAVVIEPNQRIAQMVIKKIPIMELTVVDELSVTARGSGGFGSTGKF